MSIRTRPGVLAAVAIIALVTVHVLVTVVGVLEASRWLGGVAIVIVLVAVTALHVVGIRRLLRRRRAARERVRETYDQTTDHYGPGHDSHGPGHDSHGPGHDHGGHGHSHDHRLAPSLAASAEGMRAVKISLTVLGATAAAQAVLVVVTASVALLADTIHNVADALTAVPIGVALIVGRRTPDRRYTYGYGRGEDLAGLLVLLAIAASAGLAAYEAVDRPPVPMG